MKRAVILGGTGVLGRAIAWRLIRPAADRIEYRGLSRTGLRTVGTYAETIPHQIDWLLATASSGADPVAHDTFFGQFLDYRLEDAFVHP